MLLAVVGRVIHAAAAPFAANSGQKRALLSCSEFAAALLFISPLPAFAADIRVVPSQSVEYVWPYPTATIAEMHILPTQAAFESERVIRLDGAIEPGDAEKLDSLTSDLDWSNTAIVVLNSPGGAFGESLTIADVIRRNNLGTFVGPGDVCLSGCALAFLGGSKQELRGFPPVPARTIHIGGRVGLHAPFNSALPANLSTEGLDLAALAEVFFSQSRETIRELQRRIVPWHISPDSVFEFLGYGPHEFYELDRFSRLNANWVDLVADGVSYPREIDLISATASCDFVITSNLGASYDYEWGFAHFDGPERFFDGDFLANARLDDIARFVGDGASFSAQAVIPGRGPFDCRVRKDRSGKWVVKTNGDYPPVQVSRTGYPSRLDANEPYPVTEFTILGPAVPFTVATGADLYIENRDRLDEVVPEDDRGVKGPSFDCAGELDPAADAICRFPTLARFDGIMMQQYLHKLARDPAEKQRQRSWLALRRDACRSEKVDLGQPNIMVMNGYCLLYLTIARVNQLREE